MPTSPPPPSARRAAARSAVQVGADHDVLARADAGEGLGDLEGAHHAGGADLVRRQAGDVATSNGRCRRPGRSKPAMANVVVLPRRWGRSADDFARPHVECGIVARRPPNAFDRPRTSAWRVPAANRPISPSGKAMATDQHQQDETTRLSGWTFLNAGTASTRRPLMPVERQAPISGPKIVRHRRPW